MSTDDGFDLNRGGMLDSTVLEFGKYKGLKTPEWIAEHDAQYLRWAYENVGNFNVCSEALYKDIGGRGQRAEKKTKGSFTRSSTGDATSDYEKMQRDVENKVPNRNPARPTSYFDDMDDDIPF